MAVIFAARGRPVAMWGPSKLLTKVKNFTKISSVVGSQLHYIVVGFQLHYIMGMVGSQLHFISTTQWRTPCHHQLP